MGRLTTISNDPCTRPALSIRLGPSPVSSSPFAGFPPTLSNGTAWALILPFPPPMQKVDCRLARLLQPLDNIFCQVVKISLDIFPLEPSLRAPLTLSLSPPLLSISSVHLKVAKCAQPTESER